MREFNGRTLELLAPAGNIEILEGLVKTGCDAIYFGGKSLNMRMIRKGFNFNDEEMARAIGLCHDHGKKAYVTVNNLVDFREIAEASEHLSFLSRNKTDAVIIQDFAILELIRELGLDLDIHASVMMNIHNVPMIKALERLGVSRAVLSRETTLAEVRWIHSQTSMELEYFTHGDMCIAHGGQCYYSSMLFGMSSNRGRCLKPCRWWFSTGSPCDCSNEKNYVESNEKRSLEDLDPGEKSPSEMLEEAETKHEFPLAVKDLCLYQHLPEMVLAGVTSFKIEGRMREKEFICMLVDYYADAFDRFIRDPAGYDRHKEYPALYNTRKRSLSTGYAFGKPGLANINTRYEGTGKFYSTGKMFSTPTKENNIDESSIDSLRKVLVAAMDVTGEDSRQTKKPGLSVRVNNMEQALAAIEEGVDRLYLASDVLLPDKPFTIEQIIQLKAQIAKKHENERGALHENEKGLASQIAANHAHTDKPAMQLYIATPRMTNETQLELLTIWLRSLKPFIDGILISNLGALEQFRILDMDMAGDFGLNIYNNLAAGFYINQGLSTVTTSLELSRDGLAAILNTCPGLEIVVHGRLPVMYFEHDFHRIYGKESPDGDTCGPVVFRNEAGVFEIYKDSQERSQMMTRLALNLMPVLDEIIALKPGMLRIEGQLESVVGLRTAIRWYKAALSGSKSPEEICREMDLSQYTFGALNF